MVAPVTQFCVVDRVQSVIESALSGVDCFQSVARGGVGLAELVGRSIVHC